MYWPYIGISIIYINSNVTAEGKKPLKVNLQQGFWYKSQDWRLKCPHVKYFGKNEAKQKIFLFLYCFKEGNVFLEGGAIAPNAAPQSRHCKFYYWEKHS